MANHFYHPPLPTATEIADRLGLRRSRPGEWRGQCPACSYPSAAVLSERGGRPVLWCASCADRAALAAALRSAADGTLPPADRPERLPRLDPADPAARLARAMAIWNGAEPIEAGSPAGLYLACRRIEHVMRSPALRWRSDVPHPSGGRRIALLAAITGQDGELAGVQRVYLDRDGNKANIEPVKASLGVIAGGACRLQECSEELVIAEGVETAAAAAALLGKPAWSSISCGNLGRSLALPASVRSVVIAVDNDGPGQAAAREAWRRWTREGKRVLFATPKKDGADFADIVMGGVR
jgi:putative DNA primase/helicase